MTNLSEKINKRFSAETRNVFDIAARLGDERKQRVALVGGVVRDLLLDRSAGDADIVFEPPVKPLVTQLAQILNAELVSHERFFTFTLTLPSKTKIDVVTAREETYAAPAKLPEVTPATIEKDLKRRDFTINAIAAHLNRDAFGEVLDPFDGGGDIQRKCVRALHEKSFIDDPTRLFRAARFAGRLEFQIEPKTEAWVQESIDRKIPDLLSPVRRRHEFELILKEQDPRPALRILKGWNALRLLHAGWAEVNPDTIPVSSSPVLVDRLAGWFGPWGKDKAAAMMTDLAFEKTIKVEILSKLVQSPSNP